MSYIGCKNGCRGYKIVYKVFLSGRIILRQFYNLYNFITSKAFKTFTTSKTFITSITSSTCTFSKTCTFSETFTTSITFITLFLLLVSSCSISKDIEVSKLTNAQSISSQSIIYALPQTNINVQIEVTKTTIIKGIYSDYASKYLNMANVPMVDTQTYSISNINIDALLEADPSQYCSITYKTYPDNLNKLLSVSNNGIILDFTNTWKNNTTVLLPDNNKLNNFSDPYLLEETSWEKADTFYKTIITDSTIVKIPVIKKQTVLKSIDDFAKEAAKELIKTRKRKLKILRGEYDFHPDGEALKVMISILNKQEDYYFALFAGNKHITKTKYVYSFVPQANSMSKEICFFSAENGILESSRVGAAPISIQIINDSEPIKIALPAKATNTLFVRTPTQSTVSVKLKGENIATARLQIYQFGVIRGMPMK